MRWFLIGKDEVQAKDMEEAQKIIKQRKEWKEKQRTKRSTPSR